MTARFTTSLLMCMCLVATLLLTGCSLSLPSLPVLGGESGKITLTNEITSEKVLNTSFDRSIYTIDDKENLTILLVKGTYEDPQEILTIRMFWKPIPAQTPIDETATNATFHYVTFGKNKAGKRTCGVYSGAGFLYLYNNAGSNKLKAGIWQANLRLSDSTEQFVNNLSETVMTGSLIAIKQTDDFSRVLHTANLSVNETLGFPRFIRNDQDTNQRLAILP
ncbi:hypothetical protein JD969_17360 [Planctomycetota bacterium]|nr:hypothetical protein JD969_17360 [Planctomycetota bacterium]